MVRDNGQFAAMFSIFRLGHLREVNSLAENLNALQHRFDKIGRVNFDTPNFFKVIKSLRSPKDFFQITPTPTPPCPPICRAVRREYARLSVR